MSTLNPVLLSRILTVAHMGIWSLGKRAYPVSWLVMAPANSYQSHTMPRHFPMRGRLFNHGLVSIVVAAQGNDMSAYYVVYGGC